MKCTKQRFLPRQNVHVIAAIFIFSAMLSCAQTRVVKTTVHEDPRTGIALVGRVDRQQQTPVEQGYSHPVNFALGDLKYLLATLEYQEKGLLGWSQTKSVFSADELYRMAPYLVDAFSRADANTEIVWNLKSAKPGLLFAFERFTDGTMFVKDGKLNLVFANLDVKAESDLYEGNPRKYYAGGLWELIPRDGQKLVEDAGGVHYNWIEIDIEQGVAEKRQIDQALMRRTMRRSRPPERRVQPAEAEAVWQDWEEQ